MQLAALFAPALPSSVVGHLGPVSFARVLAHQGGWDEILMVLVPVSVFAVLLFVANRRAAELASRGDGPAGAPSDGAGSGREGSDGEGSDGGAGDARPRPTTPRNRRGGPL